MTRSTGRKVAIRMFDRVRRGLLGSTMLSAAAFAVATTPLLLPGTAQAADWLGTADSDYNNAANWTGGTVPTLTATFINNGAPTTLTVTAAGSINLIEFNAGAPTYEMTTAANLAMSIQNITNSSGVSQRFTANNQSAFTVYGAVTGNVVFTAGANDGSIEFSSGASAGGSRFIGAGGYLSLRGFSGGTLDLGSIEGSGFIRTGDGGSAILSVGGLNTDTTYSGVITDHLALTKVGTGTLTLTGANSYTGGTTFTAGTVSVAADSALGDASGGLTFNGGTLQTTASFTTARAVLISSGGGTFETDADTNLTASGIISGSGALTKTGLGTLTLGGTNTYTGLTTVSAGTLVVTNTAGLGNRIDGTTVESGATLTIDAGSAAVFSENFTLSGAGADGELGALAVLDNTNFTAFGAGVTLAASATIYNAASDAIFGNVTGSGTNLTLASADNSLASIEGSITTGTGGVTKTGDGTWVLGASANNTYSGVTVVAGGTLVLQGATTLGSTAAGTIVESGATLQVNGLTIAGEALSLAGTGFGTDSGALSAASSGTVWTGAITLTDDASIFAGLSSGSLGLTLSGGITTAGHIVSLGGDSDGIASGVISGTGSVTKYGEGTWTLTGANTYSGGTTISAGTLQTGNASALGSGSVDMTGADARLVLNGYQVGIAGLDGVAGAEVDLGTSGTAALGFIGASGSYSFAGNIVGGNDPSNPVMVKAGASTQTLSGDNSFMGSVYVLGGTLALASNTALSGNAFVAVEYGAQVTVDNVDITIAELYHAGMADGTVLLDGASSSLTVTLDNATNTFSGVITGTGAFIVDGAGLIQTLTGVSDYTGGTTIADGTLALTGAGALATAGALDLTGASAVFDMSGITGNRTIGDLSGVTASSVIIGSHGLTVGTANDASFDGVISGVGGTLTKAGSGTLTLGGTNSFTGLTTISGGGLQVDGSLAGALTAQSGTRLGGTGTITGAVTIEDGATLAPGLSPGTLTVGELLLSSGSILDFKLGQAGIAGGSLNDLIAVTTDLTLAGELNLSESAGGTFGLGTYTLFTYGGTLTQTPLTFGSVPIGYNVGNFTLDTATAGTVNLIVAATATDQYWVGGAGTWNAVNTNWTDESGGIIAAWGGQTAIFRDTAGTVTVDGTQSFNALRFETDGYVLEGDALAIAGAQGDVRVDTGYNATINNVISGTGLLAKGGAGTLVLGGANTYSGGTLIAGGILQISDDANLGDTAGAVTLDGGTLQLIGSDTITTTRAFTIGAAGGGIDTGAVDLDITDISGPGTLVKTGSGFLSIDGTGNLAGGVSLQEGTIDLHLGGGSTFTGNIDGVFGTEVGLIAHGTDGIYAGVISGATGLYVGGAGTVTLSGINTFTDYTIVDTGATLALTGAGSIAASDHLDLFGTLDISGTSNGASIQSLGSDGTVLLGAQTLTLTNAGGLFEGTISGTGGVTLLSGVQGFTGTSSYRGATEVAAGAFMIALTPNALSAASAFTVEGVLGAGADQTIGSLAGEGIVALSDLSGLDPVELTLGGNGTSTTFSGALIGEGTLIKTGAGTFTLTGDLLQFEGGFAVMGGELAVNSVFGGALDVLSGGTLQGSGTVGSVAVAAGATVAPGNSIGTLTVTGNATFDTGAIYQVEIDPTGASDLLAVGGVATLGGATVEVLKATGSYTPGTRYIILTAAGGVSGTFGTLTQSLPFLDIALAYDATDVYLNIARNAVTFPAVGNTPNEQSVGGAVESLGAGNPVYDSVVSSTSVDAARAAFNSLSGEIGASAKGVLINDGQFVRNAVFERLATAGSAAPSGIAVAPLGYAAPAKPQKAGDVPYPTKAAPPAMTAPASVLWAQGFGSWGSTDGNGNAASLDRDTGGFFIGADTLVGDWRLGVLGGYSQTSFDVNARASSGTSDNIHAGIYAGTSWGAVNFRSGASYTWNDISTSRNVGIPTPQLLEADYDAGTAQVFGELGYGLSFGAVDFEPFAGLAYVNLHTDGFTETGGPAALMSGSDSTDATYTTLGLRASTTFDTDSFTTTLRGMLGWRHAFGDITPTTAYQFAAGGSPFTVSGVPIAENALVMDVGLDMALTDAASIGVFYSAQFGDSAQDQSVRGTLNWKF